MSTTTTLQQVTFEVTTVTPDMAQQWLENMAPNRKASTRRIATMAKMMTEGQWIFDASPIRFNIEGQLVDGQNRLQALVLADRTITFAVARGVAMEAMAVMDTGKSRGFHDILQMAHPDLTQTTSVAALTRLLYVWESGKRGSALRTSSSSYGAIANQVLLDFFAENQEEIVEAVRAGRAASQHHLGITGGAFGLAVVLLGRIDAEDAEYFFERYRDGSGLEVGSPILALRKRATEAALIDRRAALPNDEAIALIIKAWNAFRAGTSVHILSFKQGGATPERYPEPR